MSKDCSKLLIKTLTRLAFQIFPFTSLRSQVHGKFLWSAWLSQSPGRDPGWKGRSEHVCVCIYVCVCVSTLTPEMRRQSLLLQVKQPKGSCTPSNPNYNTPCRTDHLKPNPNKRRLLRHAHREKQTELAVLWSITTRYHLPDNILQWRDCLVSKHNLPLEPSRPSATYRAPCNNKPPCGHATRLQHITGEWRNKTLSFAHWPNTPADTNQSLTATSKRRLKKCWVLTL